MVKCYLDTRILATRTKNNAMGIRSVMTVTKMFADLPAAEKHPFCRGGPVARPHSILGYVG